MTIETRSFGGNGGSSFSAQTVRSIGLRYGNVVDALILNGRDYGGGGGRDGRILHFPLASDEYISDISVREGFVIDHLGFRTSNRRTIRGGGNGGRRTRLRNIRVLGLAGRYGRVLDKLEVTYIPNYSEPEVLESDWNAVIRIIPPGEELKYQRRTVLSRLDAAITTVGLEFSRSDTAQAGVQAGASILEVIKAKFFAKLVAATSLKAIYENEIKRESRSLIEVGITNTYAPPSGYVGLQVVPVDLLEEEDDSTWLYPTGASNFISVPISDGLNPDIGIYDLTRSLSLQLPSMSRRRVLRKGFDFYPPRRRIRMLG